MERDVSIDTLAELLAVSTMTLATSSPDGQPHAAPVYFAAGAYSSSGFPASSGNVSDWRAPDLYFFSDPLSQHGQDLTANPRAGAAIHPACFDWQDIRGLQVRGEVKPVERGYEWELAWNLYQSKFPFTSGLMDIVSRNVLYVLIPGWLRLVDNRRGFGFKQEWQIG